MRFARVQSTLAQQALTGLATQMGKDSMVSDLWALQSHLVLRRHTHMLAPGNDTDLFAGVGGGYGVWGWTWV